MGVGCSKLMFLLHRYNILLLCLIYTSTLFIICVVNLVIITNINLVMITNINLVSNGLLDK